MSQRVSHAGLPSARSRESPLRVKTLGRTEMGVPENEWRYKNVFDNLLSGCLPLPLTENSPRTEKMLISHKG